MAKPSAATRREDRAPPHTRTPDSMKRRNMMVLLALLAFIAFAFALSFSHVVREVGGATTQRSN